ncbi:hypothetical protein [Actinoplanes utahensis]|uniref:Uncharacterized protein n=1 Tax=Actinoplanes utahensis TaxID=1869 RepID=A0A0A6UER4_ACTUT|nr:hypothetical protein [Actinoplanes utahensis]KHD73578.1 hypothetical protein MB27_34220 [Actinoplanes utahensis]GIF33932.1 hypothetical protein Aut01nite_69180 [Actinoplanes utahensis]
MWDGEQARARLAADGRQAGPLHDRSAGGSGPATGFEAVRDGLELTVVGQGDAVFSEVEQLDSGWMWPLIAAGIVVGAPAGWLVAASAARRRSLPAAVAGVLALAALFPPVWALIDNTVAAIQFAFRPGGDILAVHTVLEPSPYWPGGPAWLSSVWPAGPWINPALAVAGLLLTGLTVVLSRLRSGRPAIAPEVAR